MPPRSQSLLTTISASRRAWTVHSISLPVQMCVRLAPRRNITADERPLPKADTRGAGPNQEQLPHVSEEAAATDKIMGEQPPQVEEQGTPVAEVLKRDESAQDKAPQVMKEEAKTTPKGSRAFSTSVRQRADLVAQTQAVENNFLDYPQAAEGLTKPVSASLGGQGHLFGMPEMPIARNLHLKRREDPVVDQVTKLILQNGKLSKAQRTMAMILERLRTAPPPQSDPRKPLLPGAPPTSHLPLDPILYLTLAIDSVAPLMRIRSQKGAAGGGMALQIPVPLSLRQRRRTAIMWILDAASKKRSKGSGRSMFANKVADELIAIVEGRSAVWDKRGGIHKLGVAARANLSFGTKKRR